MYCICIELDHWEQASMQFESRYEELHEQNVIFSMWAILFHPLATANLICQDTSHYGNIDRAL